jgi:O-antigen chain-terminating methyltransferase
MPEWQHGIYDPLRGSETEIKKRLKKYLPYFDGCRRVLDIGCGRGEFLELLKERDVQAIGIDTDSEMVKRCLQKGVAAFHVDAHSFLRKTGESFDGIFCSQVMEHLDPDEAIDLLELCEKRLNPGGILIVITPNPRNIRVITELFWCDLTHKRLYPLRLLIQMLEERGFEIAASGDDIDTLGKGIIRRIFRAIDGRITKGIFFSGEDIFIVAFKPAR